MLVQVYFTLMHHPDAPPSLRDELHAAVSSPKLAHHLQKAHVYQLIEDHGLDASESDFFATHFQDWNKMLSNLIARRDYQQAIELIHAKVQRICNMHVSIAAFMP